MSPRLSVVAGLLFVAVVTPRGARAQEVAKPVQRVAAQAAGTHADGKAVAKPYDENANARDQIAAAVKRAKKDNRRVLIQWGGNWCGWCLLLHDLYRTDKAVAHELLYEYDVVYVDAGGGNHKNMDLADQYQANAKKEGFPYLTILDGDGKVLANQETSSFECKDQAAHKGHDAKLVLEFLTKYQAPPLKAADVLEAGLAQAKQADKIVFLHFGAPWCGWCHRLEDWMASAKVAAILSKQFVDVKIDQDRTVGGKEMLERMANSKEAGIPWFVMLDASGAPLVDSFRDGKNIGFPSAPEEIDHFAGMLKAAANKLSPLEVDELIGSLKQK